MSKLNKVQKNFLKKIYLKKDRKKLKKLFKKANKKND